MRRPVLDALVHAETLRAFTARLPRVAHQRATRLQTPGPSVIVVDGNVIAYCWLNGPLTGLAQRVRVKDPEWCVPVLWRSEMRSILAGYLRDGSLSAADTRRVMRQVEAALTGFEHLVSSDAVLKVIEASPLSAYDASSWRSRKSCPCNS